MDCVQSLCDKLLQNLGDGDWIVELCKWINLTVIAVDKPLLHCHWLGLGRSDAPQDREESPLHSNFTDTFFCNNKIKKNRRIIDRLMFPRDTCILCRQHNELQRPLICIRLSILGMFDSRWWILDGGGCRIPYKYHHRHTPQNTRYHNQCNRHLIIGD